MGITVGSYFSLYDKRAELARIYKKYGALFIVPARLDRDFMLELICGDEPGFGARPAVWTVGDLLLELQRATKEYERIIDPPDHKLILRWLLSVFLAEAEEKGAALEPGYSHAGFVSVLGENIKDLLRQVRFARRLAKKSGNIRRNRCLSSFTKDTRNTSRTTASRTRRRFLRSRAESS